MAGDVVVECNCLSSWAKVVAGVCRRCAVETEKGRGGKTSGPQRRQAQLWATRLAGATLVPFLGRRLYFIYVL